MVDKSKNEIFQIVKKEGVNKEKFEEFLMTLENILTVTSFNIYVGEDEDSELINFKMDNISPTVEEQVEYILLKEEVNVILNTLKKREKNILEQRFGLNGMVEKTLEQIGNQQGVTRERIRQIEAKAIQKLKYSATSKELKIFLEGY